MLRQEKEACPGRTGPHLWVSACPPGVACTISLMYIFCTDCWLIAVLYFTWLVFDWNTPKKGKGTDLLASPLHPGNPVSCTS